MTGPEGQERIWAGDMRVYWRLFRQFAIRELKSKYLGSISGFVWPLVQPLALLAVYSYVFVVVFQARVPEAEGSGFVPYLAIAFWPWTAFSESLQRAVPAIHENADLISKVPVPQAMLVESTVAAGFALQLAGYVAVLAVLALAGTPIHPAGLPGALAVLLLLFVFTLGLSYLLSGLQVFVRDLEHALMPILMLWFFGTPILYSISLIPPDLRWIAHANPMTWFVMTLRDLLLTGRWDPGWADAIVPAATILLFLVGRRLFRKLAPRFEDFL